MPRARGAVKETALKTRGIAVRRARPSDVPMMCRLLEELFRMEYDFEPDAGRQEKGLRALLKRRKSAVLLVAEKAGEVLGMCSVQVLISTAEGGRVGLLEDLVVKDGLRGFGIGSALLTEALKWCAFRGLLRVQLLRDAGNGPALDFYTHRGWSGTRLVCMRRRL
ncbi:MAG: GNAT family N-acetyltransferase [Nitrospiraceae bacterium]|nr:GNAT family N-acetyltransferase [Nitrospiraceae bacterium]